MTAILSNRSLCVLMLSVAVAIHDTYGECEDKRPDCYNFGQSACEAPHEQWAKNNCRKRCNLCHQDISTRRPPTTTPKTLATPSDYHPATSRTSSPPTAITTQDPRVDNKDNDDKCWQNWVGYRQGESWKKDGGCKKRCTCVDPKKNLISCGPIACSTWGKLGDNCYMRPPPPGKCCPQPTCQPTKGLLFFNGYNME